MDIKQFTKQNKDRIYLFNQGTYHKAYELLGAHLTEEDGKKASASPYGSQVPNP